MKYTGRITLVGISLFFSLFFLFSFKVNMLPFMLIFIATVLMAWFLGEQYDRAKFYGEKDYLTEAYNRRFVYEVFPKIHAKCQDVSILLVDINNFKQLNDKFGHARGDQALITLASLLRRNIRKTDIVSRWGGDEFLLILQNVDEKEIERIKTRIQKAVKKEISAYCKELNIGVAIGEAYYPHEGGTLDEVIKIADQNMYKLKFESKLEGMFSTE
jgi:diguanylate cyclase (GGDEF)-like protein